MTVRPELLEASDEAIDDAVAYADPMVLRGLLHQLTGDPEVAATTTEDIVFGFLDARAVTEPEQVALLRRKTADFLRAYRDAGAGEVSIGPLERLHRSVSLTAGHDIPDGEFELWVEQLALDPWARGLTWSQESPPEGRRDFTVAVIGAGMGGLNAAVLLKQAGVPCVVIEKNSGVGGTWFENRYPGARVDSPSRCYTHIYGVDYQYPNQFCEQRENERYFNWVADTFGVRGDIVFDTEVKSIVWDDAAGLWEIGAVGPEGPREWRANAVVSSVGFLSRPSLPRLDGMNEFTGRAFHTARWPEDLDLTGRRVAVVGTGCTGYQTVPEIAKVAEHTYVFQRTPNWCFNVDGYLAPFPPQVNWLDRNLPFHANFMRLRVGWIYGPESMRPAFEIDPDFDDPHARSPLNRRVREQRIAWMREKLASRPDLFEKMLPEAPPMSARPVLIDSDDSIFDALLRDDVTLVTDGITRITPNGVRTAGGELHEVDVIVYATGFRANDYLWPMEVRGRGGQSVEKLWATDGARAYLGAMLPGFPNFFMVYGPNTNPAGGLQVVDMEETVTRFALECIRGLLEQGRRTVEVTPDAYQRYNDELDRWEAFKTYKDPRADNYYQNEHGRSAANCPIDGRKMWGWLRHPTRPPEPGDPPLYDGGPVRDTPALHPWFGADLLVE